MCIRDRTKDIWKDMLDIRKRFEPKAEELARKYALAPYTMFIGSGALWGEGVLLGELLGARLEALADIEHVLPRCV